MLTLAVASFMSLAVGTAGIAKQTGSEASFYVGTYTDAKGSKGIYKSKLNEQTGALSEPSLVATTESPSYLALNPGAHALYAANELDHGKISAYEIAASGGLKLLNEKPVNGAAPCYVSVDKQGGHLFAASYVGGIVTCISLNKDGSLGESASQVQNTGSGPDKSRQEQSHMHWIAVDPHTPFVYSCDLGTDKVQVYQYLGKGGLTPSEEGSATATPGGGPRHGAFHDHYSVLYVCEEMGSRVTVFAINRQDGALTDVQSVSSLPLGANKRGNTTAEIQIHPNGKWLYVSNRGNDSIAVYRIGSGGLLTPVEFKKLPVRFPRGFSLDPSGHWLVVAGQNSNDIASLRVDPSTGKLTDGFGKIMLSKPVCILFRPS